MKSEEVKMIEQEMIQTTRSISDRVELVKNQVRESVKKFSIKHQIELYPVTIVMGASIAGLAAGTYLSRGQNQFKDSSFSRSLFEGVSKEFLKEFRLIRKLAFAAGYEYLLNKFNNNGSKSSREQDPRE